MTTLVTVSPQWTVRRARQLLVVLHVVAVAGSLGATLGLGSGIPHPAYPAVAIPAAVAICVIQLYHSFAAARGERPRAWQWTSAALLVLVYLPMVLPTTWYMWDWGLMQVCVMASAVMLLPRRTGLIVAAIPVVGTGVASGTWVAIVDHETLDAIAVTAMWWTAQLLLVSAPLYAGARLVRILSELEAVQGDLAKLAIGRERLRVSRDLHDLLGQSLVAISLKGDLAIRMLRRDRARAQAEIRSLTGVAKEALQGVHAITQEEFGLSVRTEADNARRLLSAAGIRATTHLSPLVLPQPVETALAWAIREGVTNVLRHSDATQCAISVAGQDDFVRLEIVNDKPFPYSHMGTGLSGLTQRAQAVGGNVSVMCHPPDRFRLLVELPM